MIFKKPKGNQNKMKLRGRKRKLFASAMLILRLLFGGLQSASASSNSKTFQSGGNSKTEISRTLNQESPMIADFNQQPELVLEGSQITLDTPSGQITLGLPRGGEWQKSGPGSRAKADARRNAQAGKFSSGSTIIPGADGFVPQSTYCRYHENAPLSCKPKVEVSDSPFQDNGGDNQPPPEDSQFDASKYKGGPSPFEEYEYKDPAVVAQNIGFNQPNRLNKSYDKHAEDCFGILENRNKENLEIFKGDIKNLAQSADEVYKGSYRYEDPAYIFLKEIDEKMTAVIVNATDGEYITSINPTSGQMEDLQSNGNIGLDTRPSMQLTLRLRGPKNNNL